MTAAAQTREFYCSALSLAAGEQLFASAPRADVWLLLEHQGPWGAQAFAESHVPPLVKAHVDGWLQALPHARLQLIRRHRSSAGAEHTLFVALARETDPVLYRLAFGDYSDLLAYDIPALLGGKSGAPALVPAEPVFLVCGNARRDKCCGQFGPPVYESMVAAAGAAAWQTTHLGGHRFAPTGAWLPRGLCFGRMETASVPGWVNACRAGRVDLAHTRGRSCYSPAEQAAEYFLRGETGELAVDAYRRIETNQIAPEEWEVTFAAQDGTRHVVHPAREHSGVWSYESCRAGTPSEVMRWRNVER